MQILWPDRRGWSDWPAWNLKKMWCLNQIPNSASLQIAESCLYQVTSSSSWVGNLTTLHLSFKYVMLQPRAAEGLDDNDNNDDDRPNLQNVSAASTLNLLGLDATLNCAAAAKIGRKWNFSPKLGCAFLTMNVNELVVIQLQWKCMNLNINRKESDTQDLSSATTEPIKTRTEAFMQTFPLHKNYKL